MRCTTDELPAHPPLVLSTRSAKRTCRCSSESHPPKPSAQGRTGVASDKKARSPPPLPSMQCETAPIQNPAKAFSCPVYISCHLIDRRYQGKNGRASCRERVCQ